MTATVDFTIETRVFPLPPTGSYRTYAIAFDLDTDELERRYPGEAWRNAYRDIRDTLGEFGFVWQQGSLQYGSAKVTAVTCVLAVQELSRRFWWFAPCVRDIRMLRLMDNDDLMLAINTP